MRGGEKLMKRVTAYDSSRWTQDLKTLDDLQGEFATVGRLLDFHAALRKVAKLLNSYGFDVAWAAELENESQLTMRQVSGNETPSLHHLIVAAGRGLTGKVVSSGTLAWVDDYFGSNAITHDYDLDMSGEHVKGLIAAPLIYEGRTFGVLAGGVRSSGTFGTLKHSLSPNELTGWPT
jgi:hypothetical protein